MFKNLKRIAYYAVDLEKAKQWYATFLNQEPVFESPLAVIFIIGDSSMTLAKSPAGQAEDVGRPTVYWEVDDVDNCFARLIELGATHTTPPKKLLTLRVAQVVDPFGNILGISSRIRPDGAQAVENQPSESAHSVALFRALLSRDSRFGKRMFDPYSELFLKETMQAMLSDEAARQSLTTMMIARSLYGYFIARSSFVDETFARALQNRLPQIVFLGAGYDTRALRFQNDLGATRVFEVDAESTQNRKKERLHATNTAIPPQLLFIGVNFKKDNFVGKLQEAGFDRTAATLFIWEGVIYYLAQETIDGVFELLRDNSPSGSGLCFDYAIRKLDAINPGEPFLSWMDPAVLPSYLERHGFRLIDDLDAAAMSARYLTTEDGTSAEKLFSAIHLAYAEK